MSYLFPQFSIKVEVSTPPLRLSRPPLAVIFFRFAPKTCLAPVFKCLRVQVSHSPSNLSRLPPFSCCHPSASQSSVPLLFYRNVQLLGCDLMPTSAYLFLRLTPLLFLSNLVTSGQQAPILFIFLYGFDGFQLPDPHMFFFRPPSRKISGPLRSLFLVPCTASRILTYYVVPLNFSIMFSLCCFYMFSYPYPSPLDIWHYRTDPRPPSFFSFLVLIGQWPCYILVWSCFAFLFRTRRLWRGVTLVLCYRGRPRAPIFFSHYLPP